MIEFWFKFRYKNNFNFYAQLMQTYIVLNSRKKIYEVIMFTT